MEVDSLICEIKRAYQINIENIGLHREMIGKVYFLQDQQQKYMFKIYRNFKSDDAFQTVQILDYLKANSYPAVSVVRTIENDSHIMLSSQDGSCVGILYDYVEGAMPEVKIEAESIGNQIAEHGYQKLPTGYCSEELQQIYKLSPAQTTDNSPLKKRLRKIACYPMKHQLSS